MIDSLLNLLFRCGHRRLTRPLTAGSTKGGAHGKAYVVCLDCGKQFDYDLKEMRIGKPVDPAPQADSRSHKIKLKYRVLAAIPLALAIGAFFKSKKST